MAQIEIILREAVTTAREAVKGTKDPATLMDGDND